MNPNSSGRREATMTKRRKRSGSHASERELLEQLAAAPLVDVLGVLAASGVSGCWVQGDTLWTVGFCFASWRIAGGPLRTQELHVRRKVRQKQIDKYRELVKPDAVTQIRARVVEDSVFGHPEALLVRVVGQDDADAELNAEVKRLQQPVTMKDKTFGTFTLDRRIDWYEARAAWNGRKVRLSLAAHEPRDVERAMQVARSLWRAQKSWQTKVSAYAVRELLPLKNGNWLGDEERPLTAKQFQATMKLESITISPDGSFEFWHDDGALFWGHSIQISGSLTKGLYSADIPG
jgi:hypothetical protein